LYGLLEFGAKVRGIGNGVSCIPLGAVHTGVPLEVLVPTRLNASAATVLSRRGVVIPHVQWEQHQPLKSSPSTRIKFLFIHRPLRAFGFELGHGGLAG
jgi:hypothetical protein